MSRTAAWATTLVVVCVSVSGAVAETSRDSARRLVREGNTLIAGNDCKAALERFRRAKSVYSTSYKIDVNIGTALECLGRSAEAATHYDAFVDRADASADRGMIDGVRSKLGVLRQRVGAVTLKSEEGVLLTVDGIEIGRTPLRRPLYLSPGPHQLAAVKGQRRFSTTLQINAGERREVVIGWRRHAAPPLTPTTVVVASVEAPARQPSTTPIYKRWWFWTIIGVAVVGATVGVVATQTGGSERLPAGEGGIRISLR